MQIFILFFVVPMGNEQCFKKLAVKVQFYKVKFY